MHDQHVAGNAKGANRKQPVQATKGAKASAQASVQGLGYKAAAEQATTEPQYLMLDPSILAGPLPQAVPVSLCDRNGNL